MTITRWLATHTAPAIDRPTSRTLPLLWCLTAAFVLADHTLIHDTDARLERDHGQATTEYALVMLAAALVALLVVAWATAGGGAGKVGRLFDRILDDVISRV